jgi:thiol-disulfide isomerase/thioredoxin
MALDLSNAKVFVALVVLDGCGACEEFEPRFRRAVEKLQRRNPEIPVGIYKADDERADVQAFLDRFGVTSTPTLLILCRGPGSISVIGSVDSTTLDGYLAMAEHVQRYG